MQASTASFDLKQHVLRERAARCLVAGALYDLARRDRAWFYFSTAAVAAHLEWPLARVTELLHDLADRQLVTGLSAPTQDSSAPRKPAEWSLTARGANEFELAVVSGERYEGNHFPTYGAAITLMKEMGPGDASSASDR